MRQQSGRVTALPEGDTRADATAAQPAPPFSSPILDNGRNQISTSERSGRLDKIQHTATLYWEATGIGGVFMGLGGLLIFVGVSLTFLSTEPAYRETKTISPGVVRSTYFPGRTPTKSQLRRGRKCLFGGVIIALLGACITYGSTAVYNTLDSVIEGRPLVPLHRG